MPDVNGKVIHLVERAPPQSSRSTSGTSGASRTAAGTSRSSQSREPNSVLLGAFTLPTDVVDPHHVQVRYREDCVWSVGVSSLSFVDDNPTPEILFSANCTECGVRNGLPWKKRVRHVSDVCTSDLFLSPPFAIRVLSGRRSLILGDGLFGLSQEDGSSVDVHINLGQVQVQSEAQMRITHCTHMLHHVDNLIQRLEVIFSLTIGNVIYDASRTWKWVELHLCHFCPIMTDLWDLSEFRHYFNDSWIYPKIFRYMCFRNLWWTYRLNDLSVLPGAAVSAHKISDTDYLIFQMPDSNYSVLQIPGTLFKCSASFQITDSAAFVFQVPLHLLYFPNFRLRLYFSNARFLNFQHPNSWLLFFKYLTPTPPLFRHALRLFLKCSAPQFSTPQLWLKFLKQLTPTPPFFRCPTLTPPFFKYSTPTPLFFICPTRTPLFFKCLTPTPVFFKYPTPVIEMLGPSIFNGPTPTPIFQISD